jgi:RNA:NAD 2'-phosphotransferase (TPT1/KptA family)
MASITEYPFLGANAQNGYRVFPGPLENDQHVFFHGTAEANLKSIIANGFVPGSLPSVSFASGSPLALRYACEARNVNSPSGCIIAVRFNDLTKPGIVVENFGIHVYKFHEPLEIIGYCIIPANYRYV